MDIFSLSSGSDYLKASIPSRTHGMLSFTLSTLTAGDLSTRNKALRESYFREHRIPTERVAYFHQTHSKRVVLVTTAAGFPLDADGGATIDPGIVLSITVGDCIPVALFDTEGGGFALVHSGWKGTGIAVAALDLMKQHFGTRPEAVHALIGPGIGSCCYNVPEERAAAFGSYGDGVVECRNEEVYLDLKAANRVLLERAGVKEIGITSLCTCCSDFLGSYRRQGPTDFTRMVAVVGHF